MYDVVYDVACGHVSPAGPLAHRRPRSDFRSVSDTSNDTSSTHRVARIPWRAILVQGLLIVVSVYVAIVLEGISQDRRDANAARIALVQMLGEMRQDRADLQEIRAEQRERDRQYVRLDGWLADPASIPADSFTATLDLVASSNRTLYPRSSAWTTMVAAGQLRDLGNPELVTRLGNFYESLNDRVIDNGDDYDESLNDLYRNSFVRVWDFTAERPLTTDVSEIVTLRNQLRWLHRGWNLWYLDLLEDYEGQLDALIADIEAYRRSHGGGD